MTVLMQGLPFVHPEFAAAALAAAAVPVVIHLLNRRRYVPVEWAAMRFLRAAGKRSARRVRVEQLLLLAVRSLLIALVFLALSRPFLPASALGDVGRSRSHRIILLDNSCSMRAAYPGNNNGGSGLDGETRFDRAVAVAKELVSSFPSGDAVSLVTLAAPARAIVGYAAYDRRRVGDQLSQVGVTWRVTDLAGGLSEAVRILKESEFPRGNRTVYVVSDHAATAWGGEEGTGAQRHGGTEGRRDEGTKARRHEGTEGSKNGHDSSGRSSITTAQLAQQVAEQVRPGGLVLVSIAGGELPANVAVTSVRASHDLRTVAGSELPLRLEVDVANFSDTAVEELRLVASVDDRIVRRVDVGSLGAFETRTSRFSIAIGHAGFVDPWVRGSASSEPSGSGGSRPCAVEVSLDALPADGLAADDRRVLVADLLTSLPVLLVEGHDTGGDEPADGAFDGAAYLAAALSPRSKAGGPAVVRTKTIAAADLSVEPLGDYAVIALCNVGRLVPEDWSRLESFVGSGGGLLVFGGGLVDVQNYNRYGYANGDGVLPGRIEGVTDLRHSVRQSVNLKPEPFTHPVLIDFADYSESGLFLAGIQRYLNISPGESGTEVLMRYANADPALLSRLFKAGRVLMMSTSADMSWSNLPAKGDFVSLMVNAVTYLSQKGVSDRSLAVGDSIREPCSAAELSQPVRVTLPDGTVGTDGRIEPFGDAVALVYGPVEMPGCHAVSIGSRKALYAVNVDPRESDLRVVKESDLRELLGCDFSFLEADGDFAKWRGAAPATTELGGLLLFAVVFLGVVEPLMALKFGAGSA